MIKFTVARENIGRYHGRYHSQVMFWLIVPGNGRVRGRIVSVTPESLGPKVEVIMSVLECFNFQPYKHPFSTNDSFKWVGPRKAERSMTADRLDFIERHTFETVDFRVSLQNLSKDVHQPEFKLGEDIRMDVWVPELEPGRRGWITRITSDPHNPFIFDVRVRLKPTPEQDLISQSFLQNTREYIKYVHEETDDMKIYEAVIVKVDEKNVPTEIVKVVPPFLAKDDTAARTTVTVDYAVEKGIAGKDLTGIQVLVRTFQSAL